jgi:hypothetical protein
MGGGLMQIIAVGCMDIQNVNINMTVTRKYNNFKITFE